MKSSAWWTRRMAELALSRYELRLAKSLAHVVNILDPDVIVLAAG
jgi:fructokinase